MPDLLSHSYELKTSSAPAITLESTFFLIIKEFTHFKHKSQNHGTSMSESNEILYRAADFLRVLLRILQ
jgi:hypothetical protein